MDEIKNFPGSSNFFEAIQDFKNGKMVVLTDDEDRENEGDFVIASEFCDPEAINFMAKYARGLICISLTSDRVKELSLDMAVNSSSDCHTSNFTVSVDYNKGTTTGISAFDRAKTVKYLISNKSKKEDFNIPGHMFPLRAMPNGVLDRTGHTEGSIDLCKISNLYPSAVICEILSKNGSMALDIELNEICRNHNIHKITIKDIILYRKMTENFIKSTVKVKLPTVYCNFNMISYESIIDNKIHLVLINGRISHENDVLVRVHSECITGDLFSSLRCDCGNQMKKSLSLISDAKCGIFIYLRQEGRGLGLKLKLQSYLLQEQGLDTVEADNKLGVPNDIRDYTIAAHIIKDLNIKSINLLTNNPSKIKSLKSLGINISNITPIKTEINNYNQKYMNTKRDKFDHYL